MSRHALDEAAPQRVNGCVIALLLLPVGFIGTLAVGFEPVGKTAVALTMAMFTARTWQGGRILVPEDPYRTRETRPVTFWSVVAISLAFTLVAFVAAYRALEEALGH